MEFVNLLPELCVFLREIGLNYARAHHSILTSLKKPNWHQTLELEEKKKSLNNGDFSQCCHILQGFNEKGEEPYLTNNPILTKSILCLSMNLRNSYFAHIDKILTDDEINDTKEMLVRLIKLLVGIANVPEDKRVDLKKAIQEITLKM